MRRLIRIRGRDNHAQALLLKPFMLFWVDFIGDEFIDLVDPRELDETIIADLAAVAQNHDAR